VKSATNTWIIEASPYNSAVLRCNIAMDGMRIARFVFKPCGANIGSAQKRGLPAPAEANWSLAMKTHIIARLVIVSGFALASLLTAAIQ